MKKKYLWVTLALAGLLVFGNAPLTVCASSVNAGGTIVNDSNGGAGDTLNIGEDQAPLAAMAAGAAGNSLSWIPYCVGGVLTAGVAGTGVWAVVKSKNKKTK